MLANPKLPPMPKLRATSGKKRGKKKVKSPEDLNRLVQWRWELREGMKAHVYGTCARCERRVEAVRLKWVPDRLVFGELMQGYWACRGGCEED